MILVVVLMIITLLAILGASFSYRMNADLAAVKARQDQQQAELAARSGIDRVIWVLRDKRTDVDNWYNNQKWFRRIPVWMPGKTAGSESLADQEPVPGQPAWRFSIVSYRIEGDTARIRYGVTDEASKVNLNTANRAQLIRLFEQLKLEDLTPEELVDPLIDWRDKDDETISTQGAESSYYNTLDPPYKAKNGPLDTVEELLMIKNFDGRILYGEDYNRNGYLDENEDDGPEGAFPPDNGDGVLNRGLLPLVTIYSWDWNMSNDNKRRTQINLEDFNNTDALPEYITSELSPELVQFIAEARKRGYRFKSPAELLGLEVYQDGTSNYDAMWRNFARKMRQENRVREEEEEDSGNQADPNRNQGADNQRNEDGSTDEEGGAGPQGRDAQSGEEDQGEQPRGGRRRTAADRNEEARRQRDEQNANDQDSGNEEEGADAQQKRDARRRQSIRGGGAGGQDDVDPADQDRGGRRPSRRGGQREDNLGVDQEGGQDENAGRRPRRGGRDEDARNEDGGFQGQDDESQGEGRRRGRGGRDGRRGGGEGTGEEGTGGGGGGGRGRGTPIVSPATAQDMVVVMDRLTTIPAAAVSGLINVNTAPVEVLKTIPGLEPEQAEAIVAKRAQVTGAEKASTGWLVSTGAVDAETFALISNQITTRSIQFAVDAIGFADHVGAMRRIQAVIEMRGQVSQIKYYRDITSLGMGYPVRDDERSEGFAFSDR